MLVVGVAEGEDISQSAGAVARSLFLIGINLWYFCRRQTLEWYRQMSYVPKKVFKPWLNLPSYVKKESSDWERDWER